MQAFRLRVEEAAIHTDKLVHIQFICIGKPNAKADVKAMLK